MNRNATAALALLLASSATFGFWKLGWNGPPYARVLSATPVAVTEPRYADVGKAVPVRDAGAQPAWEVSWRSGDRVGQLRLPQEPDDQVRIGNQRRVIGYDVAWRWRERSGVVRLDHKPGRRLSVVDGAVAAPRRPLPGGG